MSRMELKPRILSVLAIIFFATFLWIMCLKLESEGINKETGVVSWLDYFSKSEFQVCDSITNNYKENLYSIYSMDSPYYNKVLSSLVSCIKHIEVKEIIHKDDSNEYLIYVEYYTYKPISELVISNIDDLKADYIAGKITNLEFQAKLERVYFDVFCNNCFQLENDLTRSQVLTLSEKNVNGVTCVEGTVSFVESLLSDSNITGNVLFYETNIKEQISNLIKTN